MEPLLDQVAASGNVVTKSCFARRWLQDYLRQGDWAKADVAYQALNARLGAKLTPDEQDEIEMPVKLLPWPKTIRP